jgi:hypothetical protein
MISSSPFPCATRTLLKRTRFSQAEDRRLRDVVLSHEGMTWDQIATQIPGRTARQCRDRFNNYLSDKITSEAWSASEDEYVMDQYRLVGPHWSLIAAHLTGRTAAHVKNRWYKHLSRRAPPVPNETVAEPEKFDWEQIIASATQKQSDLKWCEWTL